MAGMARRQILKHVLAKSIRPIRMLRSKVAPSPLRMTTSACRNTGTDDSGWSDKTTMQGQTSGSPFLCFPLLSSAFLCFPLWRSQTDRRYLATRAYLSSFWPVDATVAVPIYPSRAHASVAVLPRIIQSRMPKLQTISHVEVVMILVHLHQHKPQTGYEYVS